MFRNHCSNVIKNMYDSSYYHLTHNQLRRFENVCFLAIPFYKLDINSLLEILVFNFIFRSFQKFLASVLCMFQLCFFQVQMSILTVVFFVSIALEIQNMSLNEMRRRSYTLKIASQIKENLVFLKPVLQNAQQISKKTL